MTEKYKNLSGKPYTTNNWLDNHHAVKSRLRTELVHKLPIIPGSKILDIGCGTGLWTLLFAERVGHKGTVVGVDQDYSTIELAEQRRSTHYLSSNITFKCSDTLKLDLLEKFDLIVLFNVLSYIEDPLDLLISLRNFLNENGTILIKDSDIGSDFYWPVDVDLYHRLMINISKYQTMKIENYDPLFARKVPGIIKQCGFSNIQITSQSFSFCFPVDSQERKYISANGRMISDFALCVGDIEGAKQWASQFSDSDSQCIFDNPEFLYTMTEFIFHACAPANS